MILEQADDVRRIVAAAEDLARGAGRGLSTVHHLLAMFVTPCAAAELLEEAGADHQGVLDSFRLLRSRDEGPRVLEQVWQSAAGLASSSGTSEVDSTVLLAGLLRVRRALAARVLREAGIDVTQLRARVIGQLTLGLDRGRLGRPKRRATHPEIEAVPATATPRGLPLPTGLLQAVRARDDELGRGRRAPSSPRTRRPLGLEPMQPRGTPPSRQDRRDVEGGARSRSLPARSRPDDTAVRHLSSSTQGPVEAPSAVLSHQHTTAPSLPTTPADSAPPRTSLPPAATSTLAAAFAPTFARGVFQLDPEHFPLLTELGRNLTESSLDGEVQPLIGRDDIVDAAIDVLMMRQVNNPCLVGEAGVGKTAIVEGLARRLAGQKERYGPLGEAAIVELSVSSLLAGTSFRGAFSQRMKALRDEVALADGQVIVFMDEIHTLMGAGAGDGPLDAANDLKTALARGKFPLIGATTKDEYRRHVERDPAMERRFQVIDVPEPSTEEAISILGGIAPIYSRHHGVPFAHDAVVSAVHLSKRFITDRCLPDKAIAVLDRAGSQARRRGKDRVEADDVARAVHQLTRVPLERLLADERSRIRELDSDLRERIVGHDDALARVARRVQRNYAGFAGDRPLASFLFYGPPGTGKTAAAGALAQALFLVDDALVRFDMNEYTDAHSVSRLLGSPPGYVGHREPGLLSQTMHKRPYRVLLFDDVDRAAPEVVALLLQIVDSGRIRDNQGQLLDLRNTIVVLTSTIAADALQSSARPAIGFGRAAEPPAILDEAQALEVAQGHLGPELLGRVDDKVLFRPLDVASLRAVAAHALKDSLDRLFEARLVRLSADESVVDLVVTAAGTDASQGARPIRAQVERLVESYVAEQVLDGRLKPGVELVLCAKGEALCLVAPVPALPDPVDGTQAVDIADAMALVDLGAHERSDADDVSASDAPGSGRPLETAEALFTVDTVRSAPHRHAASVPVAGATAADGASR